MIICRTCNKKLPEYEFRIRNDNGKIVKDCRKCESDRTKKYRENELKKNAKGFKEKILASVKKWRLKNRTTERIKDRDRKRDISLTYWDKRRKKKREQ